MGQFLFEVRTSKWSAATKLFRSRTDGEITSRNQEESSDSDDKYVIAPTDGELTWLVVAASFMDLFICEGIIYSFALTPRELERVLKKKIKHRDVDLDIINQDGGFPSFRRGSKLFPFFI